VKCSLKTKISTAKYSETRAFYETVFGMAVVEEWSEPGDVGAILAFPGGRQEAFLEIYDIDDQKDFDGLSLQFRVDSIADFMAVLPENVGFEGPSDRPWGSTYLYMRDPNNIRVIVYEGGF
jgi:catechol 2,3-dioxygenase-like lactoylglutathione lyase family enzyme